MVTVNVKINNPIVVKITNYLKGVIVLKIYLNYY